jgi:hypothetical protein
MESIRATIKKVVGGWQDKQQKEKRDILMGGLERVLTKQERRHIRHYSLSNSRVLLAVDSSIWLYTLNLKKEQLLRNLNRILQPKEVIVEILLQLDTKQIK